MEAIESYGRFYATLKRLPGADKDTLVEQYTNGRTTHLRLMEPGEYERMCRDMERVAGYDERREAYRSSLKRARSGALHQMQLWGVDTADWERVNAFCSDRRIAGKDFRSLDVDELNKLNTKIRMMIRKRDKK